MQFSQPCHVLIDPLCPPSLTRPAHPLMLLSPDHNRQLLQHLLPGEISTESFTHLLFLLCPLSSSLFPSALISPSPPSLSLSPPLNYSFTAAGTEPEWRKLSRLQRFMSSTSTTATWVTLRPWIWLCATSAEYFIAIINIIVWGSQNTCISQVLFCHTHSRRESSICGGVSCTYSDTSCLLISTFKAAQQPLFIFSAGVFRTNMMQACLFPCIVCNWSRECNWVYHFYSFSYQWQKQNSPSLFFFFLIFDDEGTISLQVHCGVCFYPRAYTCLHHQMAHAASLARRRFPRMQWSGTVCDLTSKWGGVGQLSSAPGLAGRLDASWRVAESVILRGRPGAQKKKWSWYLPLPFCSFSVISGWVILALILCLCVMSY